MVGKVIADLHADTVFTIRAVQEGLIVFDRGNHQALLQRWDRLAREQWNWTE